jgi:hypothetical protein
MKKKGKTLQGPQTQLQSYSAQRENSKAPIGFH